MINEHVIAEPFITVIARNEVTKQSTTHTSLRGLKGRGNPLDCFAALAMTRESDALRNDI